MWNTALWNSFLFQDVIYVLTSAFNGALFIQRTKIVTLEWDSFPLFANKFSDVSRKWHATVLFLLHDARDPHQ